MGKKLVKTTILLEEGQKASIEALFPKASLSHVIRKLLDGLIKNAKISTETEDHNYDE